MTSDLQESFKVKFEANPKYVKEFIQINVTVTWCEKQLYIKGVPCVLVKQRWFSSCFSHSDSEELPSTLHDNSVQLSIPVTYEAGILFSA